MKNKYFIPLFISTAFGLVLWFYLVLQSIRSNMKLCPSTQKSYAKEILSVENPVPGNIFFNKKMIFINSKLICFS